MTFDEYKDDQIKRLNTLLSIATKASISDVLRKWGEVQSRIDAETLFDLMVKYGDDFAADLRTVGFAALESPEIQAKFKAYPNLVSADGEKANAYEWVTGIMNGIGAILPGVSDTISAANGSAGQAAEYNAMAEMYNAQANALAAQSSADAANSAANTKTVLIVGAVVLVIIIVVAVLLMLRKK